MAKEKDPVNTFTSYRKSDREFVMSRIFDAPREVVFQVYIDPLTIPHWWGPRRFTTTVDKMDVRPGGLWRYIHHGEAGEVYAFNGEYREIVPFEKIVSTFEFEGMPGHIVEDTAIFEDVDGKTRITVISLFQSAEDLDGMLQSGMESGANESWDRLEQCLSTHALN